MPRYNELYAEFRKRGVDDIVCLSVNCARAKKLLGERGWAYDEIPATPRRLRAVSGKGTTPQVFIDGQYIGGADELEGWLSKQ